MNKLFKRFMLLASVGITIVVGGLLIQSCSSEFENSLDADNKHVEVGEYLDCSGEMSPKEELFTLDKAIQRIGKHFVVEDDTCYLTVNSAKEMNMSDAVFSMVKQYVKSANIQYGAYLFFKENDKGITIRNPFDLKLPIIMTRVSKETESGPQFVSNTYILNNEEAITVMNAMRTSNSSTAFFASLAAAGLHSSVGSLLIGIYGGLNDAQLSKIQDDYARSGSTNGIVFKEVTTWSPTTGMSYTTYRADVNN